MILKAIMKNISPNDEPKKSYRLTKQHLLTTTLSRKIYRGKEKKDIPWKKSNDDPFSSSVRKIKKELVKIFHHYTNLLMPNDLNFSNDQKTHQQERFKINKKKNVNKIKQWKLTRRLLFGGGGRWRN